MKMYLIRHGQTTGDLEDRYGGDYDDHLTQEGKKQAQKLAEDLEVNGIQIILASPKIRAQETAEIIKTHISCRIQTLEDLRERNQYGVLTGLVKLEAEEKYPELVEKVKDYKNTIDGAESYEDFKTRVEKVFTEVTNSPHETIAALTHGGIIRVIFREILKAGEVDISDCGYAVLNKTDLGVKIEKMEGVDYRTD